MPDDADPIALLAVGDEVRICDWYNDMVRRFSISGEPLAVRGFFLLLLILAGSIGYLIVFHSDAKFGFAFVWPGIGLLSIVALLSRINRSNAGTAIRVDGKRVTLRDYSGRESSCPLQDVRYDDTAIATPDAMVFLGRPPASIYKRKDLNEQLFPRLAAAHKVSPLQMQKILIQQRHPQAITAIIALIALLTYAVWAFTKWSGDDSARPVLAILLD